MIKYVQVKKVKGKICLGKKAKGKICLGKKSKW